VAVDLAWQAWRLIPSQPASNARFVRCLPNGPQPAAQLRAATGPLKHRTAHGVWRHEPASLSCQLSAIATARVDTGTGYELWTRGCVEATLQPHLVSHGSCGFVATCTGSVRNSTLRPASCARSHVGAGRFQNGVLENVLDARSARLRSSLTRLYKHTISAPTIDKARCKQRSLALVSLSQMQVPHESFRRGQLGPRFTTSPFVDLWAHAPNANV
jgi:hypothetical protein